MTSAASVKLRPATAADSELVFGWRNDPYILARGTSQRAVGAAEHGEWFAKSMAEPDARRLVVIEEQGEPVGLLRFDRRGADAAIVSVYLIERATGRGAGVMALRAGCRGMLSDWPISRIIAYVRADNAPARKAFARAGFDGDESEACPAGHAALVLRS